MNLKTLATTVAAAAMTSTIAAAGTFEKYGEVEGWKVFKNNEKATCLMEKVDDAENVVQMGYAE